jgi:hypothetical protein
LSVILREKDRLRVYENSVLRGIFGSKREEVAGGWRKLHNEEFNNVYSSANILVIGMLKSRRMPFAGNVIRMGK